MAEAFIVVDSNVLLHFRPLEELDLTQLTDAHHVTVIVTVQVIDELDDKKYSGSSRVQDRARRMLRKIEDWAASPDGTVVSDDVSVIVDRTKASRSELEARSLDPASGDDILIGIALKLQERGRSITLLSDDTGARLTARAHNLPVLSMPDEKRLQNERASFEIENARLRREIAEIHAARPVLSVLFRDGTTHARFPRPTKTEWSEVQTVIDKQVEDARRSWRPFLEREKLSLTPGGGITAEEIARYQEERAAYPEKFREYLLHRAHYDAYVAASFEIDLILKNTGGAVATDIDVDIHFPGGFDVMEPRGFPAPMSAPEEPRRPRTILENIAQVPTFADVLSHLPQTPLVPDLSRPTIRKTNSHSVRYSRDRLKHHEIHPLHTLLVAFSEPSEVVSFSFDFVITTTELPTQCEGTLHFVVE